MKSFNQIYESMDDRYFLAFIIFDNDHKGKWRANSFFNLRAKLANWWSDMCIDESSVPFQITETENVIELEQCLNDNLDDLNLEKFNTGTSIKSFMCHSPNKKGI